MRKISIIGSGGAGKSTLAKRLSSILEVPVYHLDSMFWKPGWVETEREEWADLQRSVCEKSEWILDGNYGGTIDVRLRSSDTVIFLDFNRFLCLYRVLSRAIKYYGKNRPDMAEGCNEKIDYKFIKWIYDYPVVKKPSILNKLEKLGRSTKIVVLKSPKEIELFISQLGNS